MKDFLKRLLIAGIMAFFISLLFLGVKSPQAKASEFNEWIWPTDGIITDTFGSRHGRHHGIDIAGGLGSPIHVVADGVVTKSYHSGSYGHVVFVKHDNQYETVYAHLNKRTVAEGQTIKKGEILGEMGNTGHSSGVHLHFEIHKNGWTINKENALNPMVVLGEMNNVAVGYAQQVAGVMELEVESDDKTELSRFLMESDYKLIQNGLETSQDKIQHVVAKGDTLWSIAKRYDVSIESIKDLNKLQSDIIYPEQELLLR